MSHPPRRHSGRLVFAAALLCLLPSVSRAQLVPVGPSTPVIGGAPLVRGTDTAFDSINRVYLVISAFGPVTGIFVNEAGAPVSAAIPISGGYGQYPRVAFSPHVFGGAGGFLVTWHQGDGPIISGSPSNQVHGRLISFAATPLVGTDRVIGTSPLGTWWEAAPAVAYSPTSQVFLVAWQQFAAGEVHAARVGIDGVAIGSPFVVSDSYARDPGVAWNPYDNEFGVSYSGANQFGASVTLARVSAAGAVLRRTVLFQSAATYITDIAFNLATHNYVVAYASPSTRTTEVSAAGDVVSHGLPYSPVGAYDGLSVAYNLLSGSFLLVGHYTAEIGGIELDGTGAKISAEAQLTYGPASNGSFYPRVSGNTVIKQFQISYSKDLVVATSQLVGTGTALVPPPTDTDGDGIYDYIDSCPAAYAQTTSGCPAPGAQLGDVSGDGKADIVFEHASTAMLYTWWMGNGQLVGELPLNPGFAAGANTLLVAKDDFTGDGLVDLLFQNQVTGVITLWRMQGTAIVGSPVAIPVSAGQWRIVATPDFNLDGHPDILWQKFSTGELYAWYVSWSSTGQLTYLGGNVLIDSADFPVFTSGADWRVVVAGDLNGDQRHDLLLQSQSTAAVVAWMMGNTNGTKVTSMNVPISAPAGPWRVRMLNDMNSDGKLDIVWQNTVTPAPLYVWHMNGAGGLVGGGYFGPANLNPAWRVVGGK